MLSRDDFIRLVQPRNQEQVGLPEWLGRRGIAICFLAYCCGLWFPEIAAMRLDDWFPSGVRAVRVSGDRSERRSASIATRPRLIPVSPAAEWAVKEYAQRAPVDPLGSLFSFDADDADRGRTLKNQVRSSLRRSQLADKGVRAGALRSSFETRLRKIDNADGVADYLIGKAPDDATVDGWTDEAPPLKLLTEVLKRATPVWTVEREFWRS